VIPPGSVLGVLGGGQLGRMTALSAARLGYKSHVFCQAPDEPAAQVAAAVTCAAFDDAAALAGFAAAVDVITLEFENVPAAPLLALDTPTPIRPSPNILEVTQDRLHEKDFVARHGIATAPYAEVGSAAALAAALDRIGRPAILKTRRLGYDGKGQVRIDDQAPAEAWAALGASSAILEGWVDFTSEVSVIVARGLDGAMASYVPVENEHEHGILRRTLAPAGLAPAVAAAATRTAETLATALDVIGLLAVEMFVTRSGEVLVNELAPRPHNSGHWTLDACGVDQFEQLVRAVCGLPLGDPSRHNDAEMTNLLGDEVDDWPALLSEPGARLHLYGKAEARKGRKMGHVTRVTPLRE